MENGNCVNIVCFYWQGTDRPGWMDLGLGLEYILKLYNGFKRNTSIPFNFHCLSPEPELLNLPKDIILRPQDSDGFDKDAAGNANEKVVDFRIRATKKKIDNLNNY